jgi:GT2 family glycosyltransferase
MPQQPNPPRVSILIAVWNGGSYLEACLSAIKRQTITDYEVVIWDNASTDTTAQQVASLMPDAVLIRSTTNIGMWPAMERMLDRAQGTYVLCLSIDVILDEHFLEEATGACERDTSIAAVQGKIYQFDLHNSALPLPRVLIDTCGFALTRSRKVVNLGHGEPDGPAWSHQGDIFGAEGAAPFFRVAALQSIRVNNQLIDDDYFWYGDDLDLVWRLSLYGHRQVFLPTAVAWHDRSTTKGTAQTLSDHVDRISPRARIPVMKRRLDYVNVRTTILKNDLFINLILDAPWIIAREIATILYMILLEPQVLPAIFQFFRRIPSTLAKRQKVLRHAVRSWQSIRALMLSSSPQ